MVQPIMGKYLLPFFGGSASVWMVAMLFFMAILLFGYWYAHMLSRLSPLTVFSFHSGVLLLGLFLLWVHYSAWGAPLFEDVRRLGILREHPTLQIFFILSESIGIQYFLLSSTSSLLQVWYVRIRNEEPFWLYSLSNFAALVAIAAYPFLVEPIFSLREQGAYWTVGFALYAVFMLLSAALFVWSLLRTKIDGARLSFVPIQKIPTGVWVPWLGYSTLGALLLLVCTTYATRSVASIPFLWLSPLALYLLSFSITFTKRSRYRRERSVWVTAGLLLLAVVTLLFRSFIGEIAVLFVLHAALFSSLIFCHGELYARRPSPESLTNFYLTISFGGSLAGFLAAVVAPVLFSGYWEFHITLFAALLAASWYIILDKRAIRRIVICVLVLGGGALLFVRFGPAKVARNFYGVIVMSQSETAKGTIRQLMNGTTIHGLQFTDPEKAREPVSYYGRSSGIGLAIDNYRVWKNTNPETGIRIGVIGLGAGGLAAYCDSRDSWTFYEINPAVIEFSKKYFTYLSLCPAALSLKEGDARLLLEREQKKSAPKFDVLVLDAFADDAVPVHLLTREALGLYMSRLSSDGVLAVHISSRYLDLEPVINANAEYYGMSGIVVRSPGDMPIYMPSIWVILSKDSAFIDRLALSTKDSAALSERRVVWTDDYSNLFSVLKWQ